MSTELHPQIVDGIADEGVQPAPYRLRLAVAVAITFSSDVLAFATYDKERIDPVSRYTYIARAKESGQFFPEHADLNCFQLRQATHLQHMTDKTMLLKVNAERENELYCTVSSEVW